MKNRIVCKSLVAGMVSFSLLLGQVVPAFGAVQDKESVRKYYHYQDALSEAKKRVVKVAKKDATYDKSSSDTVDEHTDEYGAVTKDIYDEAGNLISRNVNGKDVIQFSYNSAGNITSIKNVLGFETKYEYDESNRLIANIDALGNKTNYSYDGENLSKVILPDNSETSYKYDSQGRVITQTEANGLITNIQYDEAGNIIRLYDNKDLDEYYTYDSANNLLTETNSLGEKTSYTYDSEGRVTAIEYPDKTSESFSYDEAGNLIKSVDIYGVVTEYTYDTSGNLIKESSGEDVSEYTYDNSGNLLTEKDVDGSKSEYKYDAKGNIVETKDALGNIQKFSYDINDNLILYVDGKNQPVVYRYDALGQNTEIVYPDGSSEKYKYDALGNIIELIDIDGSKTTYTYDSLSRLVEKKDTSGNYEKYSYDTLGDITSITDNKGNEKKYSYDLYGQLVEESDQSGKRHTYTYDKIGQVIAESIDGEDFSYTYDTFGNTLEEKSSSGYNAQYKYDKLGQLIEENDSTGETDSYNYNNVGNLINEVYKNVNTGVSENISYTLDNKSQVTGMKTDADDIRLYYNAKGQITQKDSKAGSEKFSYDANGNLTKITGGGKEDTDFTYSVRNRLISINPNKKQENNDIQKELIETKLGDIFYKSDDNGIVEYSDGNSHTTYLKRDSQGRVVERKNPSGDVEYYEYGNGDTPIKIVKADGKQLTYDLDSEGRVLSQSEAAGGENKKLLEYRYDENGNISEATGNTGTSTYKYDNSGNILNYTDIFGKTINYTYDERGNLSKLEVAGEPPTVYTYDSEDRIISVTYGDNKTVSYEYVGNTTITHLPDNNTIVEKYNDNGDLVDKTYTDDAGNIIYKISLEYDSESRISKKYVVLSKDNKEPDTKVSTFTDKDNGTDLSNDNEGMPTEETSISDSVDNAITDTTGFTNIEYQYSYTDKSQLKSESITGDIGTKDISYTYDNAGNRISETIKTGDKEEVTTFTYDESNRLIKKQSPKRTTTYLYDKNGNRISAVSDGEKFSYTYDINDNLTGIKKNDVTIFEATYDAMGERVLTKELNANGTLESKYRLNDVSFEDTQVLSVYNDSSKTDFIYGNERTVELSTGTDSTFITDEKESALGRIGEENTLYTPFGDKEDTNFIDTQKALITGFGFDGEWQDSTGLYYLRARYYDPSDGVFLSEDSVSGDIESETGLNGYSFVDNDPVNYTDPSGNTRNRGKSTGRGKSAKGNQVSKKTTASGKGKTSNKSKTPKLKMPKISPKVKAQAKRQAKPKNAGRRLGKQNIRQSTNLSRSFERRTANSYSKKYSKNTNANANRLGRNTANRFAARMRQRPVVAKGVNKKSVSSFSKKSPTISVNSNKKLMPDFLKPRIYGFDRIMPHDDWSEDSKKYLRIKGALSDIQRNNEALNQRIQDARKDIFMDTFTGKSVIDTINVSIKNLRIKEEVGLVKLPNLGIHYDNLRNTIIRETTKAGNSIYAANIPIISNGLGRFLGATNMPKNAGVMSMIGSYYRGAYVKAFLGTTDGIYSAAAHPIKTVEGLTDIMLNPGILGKAIKDYTNEKIIHGSIEDRAEFVGQAITEIGLAVVTSGITGASEGTKTASTASKVAEIADEAGNISRGEKVSSKIVEIGEEIGDTSKIKPPSKIAEPNKLPIEVPKAEKAPIEIPEITEKPKLPELEKPIDKADDIAKEKPLYKEYIKPEDNKEVPKAIEGATAAGKSGTTFLEKNGNKSKYMNNSGTVFEISEQGWKNIESSVQSRLSSKNPGKLLEGKVADYIMNNTNETIERIGADAKALSGEKLSIDDIGKKIGDLDIMTDNYLIEVKKSVQNADLDQIKKYVDINNPKYINIGDKKVILYIDSGLEGAGNIKLKEIAEIKELGVPVVTELEELGRILR